MKTCCPSCKTIFRITPEQLKARAGKVRCGQCRTVFNALDALLEDARDTSAERRAASHAAPTHDRPIHAPVHSPAHAPARGTLSASTPAALTSAADATPVPAAPEPTTARAPSPVDDPAVRILLEPTQVSSGLRAEPSLQTASEAAPEPPPGAATPMSEAEAQAFAKTAGLIAPRDITEVPGYDKWSSGIIAESPMPPAGKPLRWPYAAVSLILLLALLGQLAFHFRGELAIRAPAARPALEVFSRLLGAQIPLPRHSELLSIEASDLQTDPAHANLLTLNATLRNRAAYAQAFPSLELTLTNTDDNAVARRILSPADYLPERLKGSPSFAANTDIAVRLWIETREIAAAGYRLYVFYP